MTCTEEDLQYMFRIEIDNPKSYGSRTLGFMCAGVYVEEIDMWLSRWKSTYLKRVVYEEPEGIFSTTSVCGCSTAAKMMQWVSATAFNELKSKGFKLMLYYCDDIDYVQDYPEIKQRFMPENSQKVEIDYSDLKRHYKKERGRV